MVRLQERGAESRAEMLRFLLSNTTVTEDELMEATQLSRSTARNLLQLLLKTGLATSKRRKNTTGSRGPGPIEYWLTTQLASPAAIEEELRRLAAGLGENGDGAAEVHHVGGKTVTIPAQPAPAASKGLFVLVKAGTNDAVLTKDGRMLRVEAAALPAVTDQYKRVLRGTALEALPLEDYYRRFYPELKGKDRPLF